MHYKNCNCNFLTRGLWVMKLIMGPGLHNDILIYPVSWCNIAGLFSAVVGRVELILLVAKVERPARGRVIYWSVIGIGIGV